jgi:hypothetical protein
MKKEDAQIHREHIEATPKSCTLEFRRLKIQKKTWNGITNPNMKP